MALAVPLVPSTVTGGVDCPLFPLLPQQTTAPVSAWIAQLWELPAAMALAVPAVPFTESGGVDSPSASSPQQTTAPVVATIAQLWALPAVSWLVGKPPAAMALAVPVVPFTESGGVDSPKSLLPQQTTSLLPTLIAQLWFPPAAMALAVPVVPFTESGGVASPASSEPQQTTIPVSA